MEGDLNPPLAQAGFDGNNHSQFHLGATAESFIKPKFDISGVCFETEIQKMLLMNGPPDLMTNHGLSVGKHPNCSGWRNPGGAYNVPEEPEGKKEALCDGQFLCSESKKSQK